MPDYRAQIWARQRCKNCRYDNNINVCSLLSLLINTVITNFLY